MLPFDPFNPTTAIELAKTLFAGISAVASSVSAWNATKSRKQAETKFDRVFNEEIQSYETTLAAEELIDIMPLEVLQALENRAQTCWTFYLDTLKNDLSFLPSEVDNATVAVKACVCRELRRIRQLNGKIPMRWQRQWEQYKCDQ